MSRSVCIIAGCGEVVNGHGFCNKHYLRWSKYGHPLGGVKNHAPAAERFERHFIKKGEDDCWNWTGSRTNAGYGRFQVGGKGSSYVGAHRFAWELQNGTIPDGMIVMHTCDNPSCVNPRHLVIGTHKENTADMLAKDRHARQAPVGTDNGKAILTPALVRYIRKHPEQSHAALAREIGCGTTTIRGVRSGRVWSHIK